ncbi:MAG TPA: type VI secretion system contractile sheath small subunit [Pyrinomonadaceae bacterium]|jgi:type VI secretion system protein ImpB
MAVRKESTQKKLERVRPPRVHIKYEVDTGTAIELKELPFVVGVLGDFSGKPETPAGKLKDRKFIEIDRDSFDTVMARMQPRLVIRVDDKLGDDADSQLGVELRFRSYEDFKPDNVVRQVEPLRELVEERKRLDDLLGKMDGNDRLEELLQEVVQNTGARDELSTALGLDTPPETSGPEDKSNE